MIWLSEHLRIIFYLNIMYLFYRLLSLSIKHWSILQSQNEIWLCSPLLGFHVMVFRAACWNWDLRLFHKDGWIMVYFKFRHSKIKIDWSLNMPYYKWRIVLLGLNYLYYDMMVIRAACWNRQIKRLKLIEVYICFIIYQVFYY